MTQHKITQKEHEKQRVTAFMDPILVKRAKVRGALEGLTISEVIEKALDAYAPIIEKGSGEHINLKFVNSQEAETLVPKSDSKSLSSKSRAPVSR